MASQPAASTDAPAEDWAALLPKERQNAVQAVFTRTDQVSLDAVRQMPTVKGYDFNQGINYDALFASLKTTGFQATSFGQAVEEIDRMLRWRLSDEPVAEDESPDLQDFASRSKVKTTIFLGYTSNMISAGVRETIRFLVQHKLVDVVVTTCGGIEEDFMKTMLPHFVSGDFALHGPELRRKGVNRIGNLLVPNENYEVFEAWLRPILDAMVDEQKKNDEPWTPSKLINRLGKEINNPDSVYYWAWKNNIPVFCPGITDGSIGDIIYFHSYDKPGLVLDVVGDIRELNNLAVQARHSGVVLLGGGIVKHHILNANLMRNGANHAIYVNTGQEFDGSDSGARPDEATSWGKIRIDAHPVKIYADASLVFPLLVAQTFAKYHFATQAASATTAAGGATSSTASA